MTDYLTRLAKRTLNLLPVAQPLITPSFSSFDSKINDRPEISFKERTQDFSLPRSKVQMTSQTKHDTSSESKERFDDMTAKISLLPQNKTRSNLQGQRHPEFNVTNLDIETSSDHINIQKQVPLKDIGISVKEEPESVNVSDQAPNRQKNSVHRIIPEPMSPHPEQEMTRSYSKKEPKDLNIPDPVSISKDFADESSGKYEEGRLLPDITLNYMKESLPTTDNFPEKYSTKKEPLDPHEKSTIRTEKYISSEPPHILGTGFKNVINPVITKSLEGKENATNNIHAKMQQPPIPTIRVTIGRVEVRAISQQPVFLPAPAIKKQTLSLDEYLKQHNG